MPHEGWLDSVLLNFSKMLVSSMAQVRVATYIETSDNKCVFRTQCGLETTGLSESVLKNSFSRNFLKTRERERGLSLKRTEI